MKSMSKVEAKLRARPAVAHVDCEDGNIIVTLHKPWEFVGDPTCGVRGFDTMSQAYKETGQGFVILTTDRRFANRSRDLMRTARDAADQAQQYASSIEDKKLRAELEAEIVNLF